MTDLKIDIVLQAGNWPKIEQTEKLITGAIRTTVETARLPLPRDAEFAVVLSDDHQIQKLNRQWRNIDKPTNVLSFPSGSIEPGDMPDSLMGDVVVARETVEREAANQGKTFDQHLTHLVIHGFLHIFGYDHTNDKDAETMENLERQCLMVLGLPDPYGPNGN